MFWNKIPKGYVETVDGYLIKESEAKKVEGLWNGRFDHYKYHRAEKAPAYDSYDFSGLFERFYRNGVRVEKDGTPIGYHTQEEVQKLKDRIKELEDKYEPTLYYGAMASMCGTGGVEINSGNIDKVIKKVKSKLKRGRPKNKSSKKKK